MKTTQQYLRHMPPGLKAALIADADAQGSNMNTVAVKILADRYKVKIGELSDRKTTSDPDGDQWAIRLPDKLHTAIQIAAVRNKGKTVRNGPAGEVLGALCDHYGIELTPLPGRVKQAA